MYMTRTSMTEEKLSLESRLDAVTDILRLLLEEVQEMRKSLAQPPAVEEAAKRGPGRPRKFVVVTATAPVATEAPAKKKPGRPKKAATTTTSPDVPSGQ